MPVKTSTTEEQQARINNLLRKGWKIYDADADAEQERKDKVLDDYLRGGDQYYRRVTNIRDVVPRVTARVLWSFVGCCLVGAVLLYLVCVLRAA